MTIVIDTLATSKELKALGFTEQQAEYLPSLVMNLATDHLATKGDMAQVRNEIERLRSETKADISDVRAEIDLLRAEMQISFQSLKNDMIKWMVGMQAGTLAMITAILGLLEFL